MTRRAAAARKAVARPPVPPRAVATRFSTAALNVRTAASGSASVITVLAAGRKVAVTSAKDGQWQQIILNGRTGWVRGAYLASRQPSAAKVASKPTAPRTSGGISSARCSSGSGVEAGLTRDAVRVHRGICAKFPQVTSFGGVRADSLPAHPSGRALDAMVSNSSVGWQIANWARSNRKQLGVSEVIYSRKIWTVQRASEGWRSMSDRGSASANHYDHVHITVYGSAGTG